MPRRKYIVGNWKMNGTSADLAEVGRIAAGQRDGVDIALCLPATLVARAAALDGGLPIGGQDVHQAEKGAHTGCVSAAMLIDAGARLTIAGHSERREAQNESSADVRAKAATALSSGLDVILCVGEALDVREKGDAVAFVTAQLDESLPQAVPDGRELAIAYEPVWAIGTGKVASNGDIAAMHRAIRALLRDRYPGLGDAMRILYGGSVKAPGSREILAIANVDGALVGGASLKAADFLPIVDSAAGEG